MIETFIQKRLDGIISERVWNSFLLTVEAIISREMVEHELGHYRVNR